MPETPIGPEQPLRQPVAGEAGRERPGYPPPGHDETMAALAAAEAAEPRDADAALDGDLAALDGGLESPEAREARLRAFVTDHFADVCPPQYLGAAVAECILYEDDFREAWGEPDMQLEAANAEDPTLREAIETQIVAQAATIAENAETIAARTGEFEDREALTASRDQEVAATAAERAAVEADHPEVTVPATAEERAVALADAQARTVEAGARNAEAGTRNAEAGTRNAEAGTRNAEVNRDLATVRELQATFEQLKAEHGTVGALQLLLEGENALQNPEMRVIVQRTINTARSLVTALPGREDVVNRLLDGANLNLGAASGAAAFADFLTAVEASEELSEDEKETLRQVINAGDEVRTGGDANEVFNQGAIETYVDENGVLQERRVPLQPGQRVPFGDGHELGIDANGQRKAWVRTEIGTFETDLPDNPTDQDMGNIIRTVQLRATLHELNVAHIFFNDVDALEYGGGTVQVHPDHFATTERFLNIVVQERALAGNNLLSRSDLQTIPYLLQFHNQRGDYGIADVDPEHTRDAYRAQGILDAQGQLDWDRFAQLVDANRRNLYAETNYARAARVA